MCRLATALAASVFGSLILLLVFPNSIVMSSKASLETTSRCNVMLRLLATSMSDVRLVGLLDCDTICILQFRPLCWIKASSINMVAISPTRKGMRTPSFIRCINHGWSSIVSSRSSERHQSFQYQLEIKSPYFWAIPLPCVLYFSRFLHDIFRSARSAGFSQRLAGISASLVLRIALNRTLQSSTSVYSRASGGGLHEGGDSEDRTSSSSDAAALRTPCVLINIEIWLSLGQWRAYMRS